MRAPITVACGVLGPVLVLFSFLNPPVSEAVRPYVLGVGLGVTLFGALIATATTLQRRRRLRLSSDVDDRAEVADEAGVHDVRAPLGPAKVALRAGGNGAVEPWVRWYHVEAATTNGVAAAGARASVIVRGESADGEQWHWQDGRRALKLSASGARIPLVIGGIRESTQPLLAGWSVPYRNWYLTPSASSTLGRFLAPFIAGFRHIFDVSVTWKEAGAEQCESASFELRFWREPGYEPRFMRLGERPSYRDQAGGLGELRDRGVALRKEGMLLPPASLNAWLGRVESWTKEARELIAEVSVADSDYFLKLNTIEAPLFEGVRIHDDRHRQALRALHERLTRLQNFIRP